MRMLSNYMYILAGFTGVLLLIILYFQLYENTLGIDENYEQYVYAKNSEEFITYLIKLTDYCFLKNEDKNQRTKCYKVHISLDKSISIANLPTIREIKNKRYYIEYNFLNDLKEPTTLLIEYVPYINNMNKKGVVVYEIT